MYARALKFSSLAFRFTGGVVMGKNHLSKASVQPSIGLSDVQDECVSQVVESRLLAANGRDPAHDRHASSGATRTEVALRKIAARLDRVAAAYLASLESRNTR